MHDTKRVALATAAAVLVAVACGGGTGPTVAPSAPAVASTAPSAAAAAAVPSLGSGPLDPGRYALDWNGPAMTIEVPDGWTGSEMGAAKEIDGAEVGWGGWDVPVTRVFKDACQDRDDHLSVDGTLQGLIDALDGQGSTDATIAPVTIGGITGTRVTLAPASGVGDTVCQTGDAGLLQIWEGPPGVGYFALPSGMTGFVDLIEIDGQLLTFVGGMSAAAAAADVAELQAVIASSRFEP